MIAFLEGVLVTKQPTHAVLQVGGVGYEVVISLNTYDALPAPGQTVRLQTVLHIREDAHVLYGFAQDEERRWFNLLLGVNGIGPKLAISVLSGLSTRELIRAVAQRDVKSLASISGVGKKTAERMALELADRLSEGERLAAEGKQADVPEDRRTRDAVLALLSLGYKQSEAQALVQRALEALPETASVEELIRKALAR